MHYDVIVIGGGIHGVGVAQAAAAGGFEVRLLEQYPALAQGTSSRSSKLIHGGLRYLERASFRLVRECLRERRLLLQNAPDLVSLKPFFIPVYRGTRRSRILLRTGLSLYAALGGGDWAALPRQEWSRLDGLDTDGLLAVYRYFDAQTDDARLTRAVARSAVELGAELQLGAQVTRIALTRETCEVEYHSGQTLHSCTAGVVVNAAGPWAHDLLSRVLPAQVIPDVELIAGTHIRLPGEIQAGIYYVESPLDQRPVFVMPWRGDTLVGTTEKPFRGRPDAVQPSAEEIAYLLDTHAGYFPGRRCERAQVLDAFAGLRVLPRTQQYAGARTRETLLAADRDRRPRLLSIFGGKLTAYRATAARVLGKARSSLPKRKPRCDTRSLKLTPGD